MHNQLLGKQGEDIACDFLKNLGYHIVERNFKKPQGDIDIVAIDSDILVFVEVKTRKSQKYGLAVEAITPWKVRELIKNAQLYKLLHKNLPAAMRIDVVAIDYVANSLSPKIELIKNITG